MVPKGVIDDCEVLKGGRGPNKNSPQTNPSHHGRFVACCASQQRIHILVLRPLCFVLYHSDNIANTYGTVPPYTIPYFSSDTPFSFVKMVGNFGTRTRKTACALSRKGGGEDEIFCNNVCSRAHILTRRKTGIDRIHDKKAAHPNKTQPRQTDSKRIVIDQTIILKLSLSSLSSFSSI